MFLAAVEGGNERAAHATAGAIALLAGSCLAELEAVREQILAGDEALVRLTLRLLAALLPEGEGRSRWSGT